jgi:hypothetical protein
MKARHTILFLAVALGGCGLEDSPVTPAGARARFDGIHTMGSGHLTSPSGTGTATSSSDSTTTVELSGIHTMGTGH